MQAIQETNSSNQTGSAAFVGGRFGDGLSRLKQATGTVLGGNESVLLRPNPGFGTSELRPTTSTFREFLG